MNIRYSLNYNQSFPKMPAVCVNRMIGDLSKGPSANQVTGEFFKTFSDVTIGKCDVIGGRRPLESFKVGSLLPVCVFHCVVAKTLFHSMTLNKFNIAS